MAKHIIFCIENLGGGGAEQSVISLVSELQALGHHVKLAVLDNKIEYILPSDLVVSQIPKLDLQRQTLKERVICVDRWLDQAEQREGKIDLIVSNLIRSDEIFSKINRNHIVFCIRNHTSVREMQGKLFYKKWSIYKNLRSIYSGKNIVALTQGVANDLVETIGVHPKFLTVINNGFGIEKIRKMASEPFVKPFPKYIVHVGSFKQQKRHDRLLHAYAGSGIDVPLVLVGKGSASREKKIRNLCLDLGIQEKVHFAGFHENVFPWISAASMLVLSSDCEGFPRVLAESLICGTPVASVNCPSGPSEILRGELRRGLSDLSVNDLARVMKNIYDDPPLIPSDLTNEWSIQSIAQKYVELSDSLVEKVTI